MGKKRRQDSWKLLWMVTTHNRGTAFHIGFSPDREDMFCSHITSSRLVSSSAICQCRPQTQKPALLPVHSHSHTGAFERPYLVDNIAALLLLFRMRLDPTSIWLIIFWMSVDERHEGRKEWKDRPPIEIESSVLGTSYWFLTVQSVFLYLLHRLFLDAHTTVLSIYYFEVLVSSHRFKIILDEVLVLRLLETKSFYSLVESSTVDVDDSNEIHLIIKQVCHGWSSFFDAVVSNGIYEVILYWNRSLLALSSRKESLSFQYFYAINWSIQNYGSRRTVASSLFVERSLVVGQDLSNPTRVVLKDWLLIPCFGRQ